MDSNNQTPFPDSWPLPVQSFVGSPELLAGIKVYYDFDWRERMSHNARKFRNGKSLCREIVERSEGGATPALLLTDREDADLPTQIRHGSELIVVVKLDEILRARGSAGATFLLNSRKRITLADLNDVVLDQDARASIVAEGLTPEAISIIATTNPERVQEILHSQLTAETVQRWCEGDTERIREILDANLDLDAIQRWSSLEPTRLRQLAEFVSSRDGAIEDAIRGNEAEAIGVLANLLNSDDLWAGLNSAGVELPALLAHQSVWSRRGQDVTEFQRHFDADDWTETQWQAFFERNTWIFGYGLNYQFLHLIEGRPHLGGRDFTGRGAQEGDMLMATGGDARFTVLVEIKTPGATLVQDQMYRSRVHKLGDDLVHGVAQIQQQAWRWTHEGSRTDENRDRLEGDGVYTHEPKGILVIGNLASLPQDRASRKVFESYRRNLVRPEVLTYDELLDRATHIVNVGESDQPAAAVETTNREIEGIDPVVPSDIAENGQHNSPTSPDRDPQGPSDQVLTS